jgi:hypothetical protein
MAINGCLLQNERFFKKNLQKDLQNLDKPFKFVPIKHKLLWSLETHDMARSFHYQATAPRSRRVLERFFEECPRVGPPPATSFPGHPVNPVICIKAAKRRASRTWCLPRGRVGNWPHETTTCCRGGSWLEYARESISRVHGIWHTLELNRHEKRSGKKDRGISSCHEW